MVCGANVEKNEIDARVVIRDSVAFDRCDVRNRRWETQMDCANEAGEITSLFLATLERWNEPMPSE